jgi:hypothetical protein
MVYVGLDDFSGMTAEVDFEEDTSAWLIEVEKEPGGQWLENALLLNPYLSSSEAIGDLVNATLEDVSRVIAISSRRRSYDALKAILLALWLAHLMGAPVRYSRRKKDYVRGARYGAVFFRYDRIIPLVDALESLGFIKQRLGWSDSRSSIGRQTRMWGTVKLWNRFRRFGIEGHTIVFPPEREEVIILRDGDREIAYRDTPAIREQREQLRAYNDFVKRFSITVDLPATCEVSNEFLAGWLLNNLLTNRASLLQCSLRPPTLFTNSHTIPVLPPHHHYPTSLSYTTKHSTTLLLSYHHLLSSITDTDSRKGTLGLNLHEVGVSDLAFLDYLKSLMLNIASQDDALTASRMLNQSFLLKDIGVDRVVFRLNSETLHRVYSRGSFACNGRAYGALHQNLPKHMRPFIRINDRPTIELDFSAYHIQMLYHQEGIDYAEDPYTKPGGPEMRDIFKAVGLVAINAVSPQSAYGAIRQELDRRGIPLPQMERPLVSLVEMFRTAHKPIERHLFSDAGIWLQNLDSHIMNGILMRLMERDILGLPVHDSVIAQREHEEVLREIMMREYAAVMGFRPRPPERKG